MIEIIAVIFLFFLGLDFGIRQKKNLHCPWFAMVLSALIKTALSPALALIALIMTIAYIIASLLTYSREFIKRNFL